VVSHSPNEENDNRGAYCIRSPLPSFLGFMDGAQEVYRGDLNLLLGIFGGLEGAKEWMIFQSARDSCQQVD